MTQHLCSVIAQLSAWALVVLLAGVPTAQAQARFNPPVPRIPLIGDWTRHDPVKPQRGHEPWQAEDVVGFLRLYPNAVVHVGVRQGKPPGFLRHTRLRDRVNEVQQRAAAEGLDVDKRLCVGWRSDVTQKLVYNNGFCNPTVGGAGCDWEGRMDGRHGEAEAVVKIAGRASGGSTAKLEDRQASWLPHQWAYRLLVLRPGGALEERRRVIGNDRATIEVAAPWQTPPRPGDPYEVRGSFDPAWLLLIPRTAHEATLQRFWVNDRNRCGRDRASPCNAPAEPLDPFDSGNTRAWRGSYQDREAMSKGTATEVPALYGFTRDEGRVHGVWEDPYPTVSGVLMDVRKRAWRDWNIRALLYTLEDVGFEPGEAPCVYISYKPAFHTWYDESIPSNHPCHQPGTNMWGGVNHLCHAVRRPGGPFNPTPYRRGEYEAAVNAYLRELTDTLIEHGYADLRILTETSHALPGNRKWAIHD